MKLPGRFYKILGSMSSNARFANSLNKVKEADIITQDIEVRLKEIQKKLRLNTAKV